MSEISVVISSDHVIIALKINSTNKIKTEQILEKQILFSVSHQLTYLKIKTGCFHFEIFFSFGSLF